MATGESEFMFHQNTLPPPPTSPLVGLAVYCERYSSWLPFSPRYTPLEKALLPLGTSLTWIDSPARLAYLMVPRPVLRETESVQTTPAGAAKVVWMEEVLAVLPDVMSPPSP